MLPDFKRHIESHFPELLSAKNINIACSGGVDSIVLVELMSRLNLPITVLHCNFQLRKESDLDEEWVKAFCDRRRTAYISKSFDTPQILQKRKGAIQEVARDLRYAWFNEIHAKDNSPVLVAHHQDDQIETFLQNLERGAGTLGLSAMLNQNGFIYRPLLPFTKIQIRSFANKNNIDWREDASNATNKYNRNIYRNEVIPILSTESKQLILQLIDDYQTLQNVSEFLVGESLTKNEISLSIYSKMPIILKKQLCRIWGVPTSGYSELDKLLDAEVGKKKEFSNKEIWRERDSLLLKVPSNLQIELIVLGVNPSEVDFTKEGVFVDADKVVGEVKLRNHITGEYFQPLGLKGKKLVSNYLKDIKIPANEKNNYLVAADKEQIVWIPGGAPAEKVRITDVTKNVLWLKIQQSN